MKWIIPILILLMIPTVLGFSFDFNNYTTEDNLSEPNPECVENWNNFMGQQPVDMIQKYCNRMGLRVIGVLMLVSLMWLFEPKLRQFVKKKPGFEYIITLYKWVGLGMLFIAMYAIYAVG